MLGVGKVSGIELLVCYYILNYYFKSFYASQLLKIWQRGQKNRRGRERKEKRKVAKLVVEC